MPNPVIHWEITGKDAPKLQQFYANLFGWNVDSNNPMNYGLVDTQTEDGINGGIAQEQEVGHARHGVRAGGRPPSVPGQSGEPGRQDYSAPHSDPGHGHTGHVHRPGGEHHGYGDRVKFGRTSRTSRVVLQRHLYLRPPRLSAPGNPSTVTIPINAEAAGGRGAIQQTDSLARITR